MDGAPNADPRRRCNIDGSVATVFKIQAASSQIKTVLFASQAERATELTGSVEELMLLVAGGPSLHEIKPLYRLRRPEQYGGGLPAGLSHEIQTIIHAVNEVDIAHAGRTEHHSVSIRPAPRGVTGRVIPADIGLDLGDASRQPPFR